MSGGAERTPVDDFTQDYRTVLLRFLPGRDEAARAAGYELGRRAFAASVSLLDVCRIHHEIALEVLRDTATEEWLEITETSAELLLEVLAAYDMTHRGVLES